MRAVRSVCWFVVQGNPVPKERPRVVGRRAFTPTRTVVAEQIIAAVARLKGARPTTAPISLHVSFYRESAHPCDLDNLVKLVQDALNGVCYVDDRQIVALSADKHIDREHPRTDVRVEECEP